MTLPAHPEYRSLTLLREFAYQTATGDKSSALRSLQEAYKQQPASVSLGYALVKALLEEKEIEKAQLIVNAFPDQGSPAFARILSLFASALLDAKRDKEAYAVLDRLPELLGAQEAFDAAIAERRAGRDKKAHQYFQAAGELILQDVRALHEFAQTKLNLAGLLRSSRQADQHARQRLQLEAVSLLERVIRLDAPPTRHAWAWYNLGQAKGWLRRPHSEVLEAFEHAVRLEPKEPRFQQALEQAMRTRASTQT